MKSFTPYDPRIRIDQVSYKKIRDIQMWTGQKKNTETLRAAIDLYWSSLEISFDNRFTENSEKRRE